MTDVSSLVAPHLVFSDEERALLSPYLTPVRYAAGETIFPEGQVCRELVVLGAGLVRAYYLHEAREVNLRFLCPPSVVVALSSLVLGAPAEETVEAVTPVEGARARVVDFERDHPGALAERMRRVLAERHYLSMERRLRMLQWKTAAERYEFFVAHMEPEIVRGMPGYHVASYLGVAPESLSRVRAARAGRS
ncbi:MAG: Crp/Fnr family transcriptional regulator [Sandaracinaceae bacterium]|nr:Crp/Fnr family transcriptional regulator [Myxococcales bacterium]MCB9660178.1 Crp/Fnr family transcriptional regulator [Sandaracinaceae bacterium]